MDELERDARLDAIPDVHGHAKGEHKLFAEERPIPYTARMLFLWFYHACRRGGPRFMMVADHVNYLTFEDPAAVNLVRRAIKLAHAGDLYGAAETAGVELQHAAVVSEGLRKGMRYSIGAEVDNDPRNRPDAQNIVEAMRPDAIVRSIHFLTIDHPELGAGYQWAFDNPEFTSLYAEVGTEKVWELYMSALLEAIEKLPAHIVGHFYVPAKFGHWPDDEILQRYEDQLIEACAERGIAIEINARVFYRNYISGAAVIERAAAQGDVEPSAASGDADSSQAAHASSEALSQAQRQKYFDVHLRLLAKAKAKGVQVTVGSDAHSPRDQGGGFDAVLQMLDAAEINEIAFPVNGRMARVALRATEELLHPLPADIPAAARPAPSLSDDDDDDDDDPVESAPPVQAEAPPVKAAAPKRVRPKRPSRAKSADATPGAEAGAAETVAAAETGAAAEIEAETEALATAEVVEVIAELAEADVERADVIEADFVEAEFVEAEFVEAEVVEAEVVEAAVFEAEVVEAELVADAAALAEFVADDEAVVEAESIVAALEPDVVEITLVSQEAAAVFAPQPEAKPRTTRTRPAAQRARKGEPKAEPAPAPKSAPTAAPKAPAKPNAKPAAKPAAKNEPPEKPKAATKKKAEPAKRAASAKPPQKAASAKRTTTKAASAKAPARTTAKKSATRTPARKAAAKPAARKKAAKKSTAAPKRPALKAAKRGAAVKRVSVKKTASKATAKKKPSKSRR